MLRHCSVSRRLLWPNDTTPALHERDKDSTLCCIFAPEVPVPELDVRGTGHIPLHGDEGRQLCIDRESVATKQMMRAGIKYSQERLNASIKESEHARQENR